MQLVRSVVAKVSNNLQYCRSIRNRQSRELCTSLRNNDGNSTKERGVSVLSEIFRKSAGIAIAYGPYTAFGGALGWYAYAYATADRDREETKVKVLNLKARWDEIEKQTDTLEEKIHTNSEANRKIIMDLITKQEEMTKQLLSKTGTGSASFRNPAKISIMRSFVSGPRDQQAGIEE